MNDKKVKGEQSHKHKTVHFQTPYSAPG